MLSAICPTYNRAGLLSACIEPLMELPHGTAEVIVVDDCSTDNTEQVCAELIHRFGSDRVRYVRLQRNEGAQVARNRGIAEAHGEYVLFIDSDDVPVAGGINELYSLLSTNSQLNYAYGRVLMTDMSLHPLGPRAEVGAAYDGSDVGLGGYHWHTMGALYRRECLERVGKWNVDLTGSQDWEFQARVKMFGGGGAFVDCLVGYWRQHATARVGTSSFRADYVGSAAKACCSIWAHACAAHKGNQPLAVKLARRLMRHALEWGAAGYAANKRSCLRSALEIAGSDRIMTTALRICTLTPSWLDRSLVQITDARARIR